ncbi:MAG: dienelactone hydrolase family protein [Segniliparus sp.]|uniref:dienelactone hydrolase family protein n=1 Tax=Segniliparus sp. TaxID=2804064 RepID=UPI003F3ADB26
MASASSTFDVQAPAGALSVELFASATPPQGPVPGVVMVHDAIGLGQDTRKLAQRVADQGYLVALPNLYARGGARKCLLSTMRAMLTGEGTAFDDIAAVREALVAQPGCNGRTAITGFCMGGGFALLFSPKQTFDVSAPFYPSAITRGKLPKGYEALLEHSCPVVASLGRRDPLLGKNAGPVLEQAFARHGVPHDVKVYEEAGHSFANQLPQPYGAMARVVGFGYSHESAEDSWRRVFNFFEEHLLPSK